MDDALFEPIAWQEDSQPKPLLRDRRALVPGSVAFGPDIDGFQLYVTSAALAQMRTATAQTAPYETLGLLLGRTFRDARGTYTIVAHAVECAEREASPDHVTLSARQMAALRRRALIQYPAEDLVGWWHTHTTDSFYSRTDRQEQATWPDPHHVGILAFMQGKRELRVYRGREARPLAPSGGSAQQSRADREVTSRMPAAEALAQCARPAS